MADELWQHALQFLDCDSSRPVEELYQFADKTGILERHKQLLALPGHHETLDLRIAYCELIKMLVEHEMAGRQAFNPFQLTFP